jgi:hypothetical protein
MHLVERWDSRTFPRMAPALTKSLFVSGHQCLKQLWWKVHEPDAVELQPDKVLQDLFDQGRQVGELARALPIGALIFATNFQRDFVRRRVGSYARRAAMSRMTV